MNNFETIEAYVEGWMNAAEKAAFEQRLHFDSELRRDYEDWMNADSKLKEHFAELADVAALRESLNPLTKRYFNKEDKKIRGRVISLKKYFVAAGAVAAAAIIYFSLPAGVGDYAVPEMPQAIVRGESDKSHKGAQLFNQEQYEAALPLLKQEAESRPGDATAQFFYAVCLVKLEKYEIALPVLDGLTKGVSAFKEDAAFFAALSAFHLKKHQQALTYARQVGHEGPYYEQAQKLIRKIK
ncbi:CDC27 family protein [Niabella insulamsoli]|uniref:CDC27 family protein n=1 Tax=Niabella insulamsoli TaxID=3144874 RepID=UPI0031FDF07C